jgi:hypothetical protein
MQQITARRERRLWHCRGFRDAQQTIEARIDDEIVRPDSGLADRSPAEFARELRLTTPTFASSPDWHDSPIRVGGQAKLDHGQPAKQKPGW